MSHDALGPQFSGLFHGTNVPGLSEISPEYANKNYRMTTGGIFTSNNSAEAARYARDAARMHGGTPTVYEVEHEPDDVDIDPHGDPSGYGPAHESVEEALDYIDAGGWTNLWHHRPLKVQREISVDEADHEALKRGWG